MALFENAVVTKIYDPFTVFSEKGRTVQMTERSSYAVSLCKSGQITYTHAGKTFVSTPDNAVLLPKGATYSLHGEKEGLFPLINFECEGLNCDDFFVFKLRDQQDYLKTYESISNCFLLNKRLKAFEKFYEFLSMLDHETDGKPSVVSLAEKLIRDSLYDTNLTNTSIAADLGISEVYLRKLFVKHYSVTPKQYIINLRIRQAKYLLENSGSSITAVSDECGFTSIYHFCRLFRSKVGCTPAEYAMQNRAYTI